MLCREKLNLLSNKVNHQIDGNIKSDTLPIYTQLQLIINIEFAILITLF